jgi:hypothetical protein
VTRAARFTAADVKRAVAGMAAAGVQIAGVEVNGDGFFVRVGEPAPARRRNRADELYGPQA